MTLPFAMGTVQLPDWLPWWLPTMLLIPVLLYLLLTLLVPFSVFGLKGRLESVEMRLDDIHAEIRMIAQRLPPLIGEEFPAPREAARSPAVYYPAAAEPEPERVRLVPPARPSRPDNRPAPRPDSRAEPRFGPR